MKKLITKFAKWWLRKTAHSINLESRIKYLGHECEIKSITMSFIDGRTELTINAKEREYER